MGLGDSCEGVRQDRSGEIEVDNQVVASPPACGHRVEPDPLAQPLRVEGGDGPGVKVAREMGIRPGVQEIV